MFLRLISFWAFVALGCLKLVALSLVPETLDDCERQGKQFCYTGIAPDRDLINDEIRNNAHLLALYQRLKSSTDVLKDHEDRLRYVARKKRESSTDCGSLCCVTTDTTPPYSYFRDKDGWQQVATTPEFPIRVSFFTETCTNENSPCRGVKSTDDDYQPQCEQIQFRHAILVYNQTLGGVQTRYVSIPSGCRCKLTAKNPFKENERRLTPAPTNRTKTRN